MTAEKHQIISKFPNVCVINAEIKNDSLYQHKSIVISDNFKIKARILPKDVQFEDKNLQSTLKQTDIAKNKYEGGLKIWECSIDLAQCIINSFVKDNNLKKFMQFVTSNDTINVLELGCGHALPSITLVSVMNLLLENNEEKNDDSTYKIMLCLQDLNKDVLNHISIPNIWLNYKKLNNFKFELNGISGDWRDIKLTQNLLNTTNNKKYDIIFGSETIYNESIIAIFMNLLINLLSKPNGICFISAKSYYFGIGGGIQSLKLFMNNNDNSVKYPFNINTIQRIDDGMSNLREIIILTWQDKCEWNVSSIWPNINDFLSEEEIDDDEEEY